MIERIRRNRLLCILALIAGTVTVWTVLRQYLSLESLITHESWLRSAIDARPIRWLTICLLVYVAVSLIPGLVGKSVIFGWLLGFMRGLVVVNVGLTLAAAIAFLISRHLIRDLVQEKFDWFLRRIQHRLRGDDSAFLLTLRLLHAPFSVVNYTLGSTDVSLRRFWWTTQLGLLPGNIAFVLAGASLPSLRQLETQGPWSLVNLPLLVGLTVAGFAPIAIRWAVHRNIPARRHGTCTKESYVVPQLELDRRDPLEPPPNDQAGAADHDDKDSNHDDKREPAQAADE